MWYYLLLFTGIYQVILLFPFYSYLMIENDKEGVLALSYLKLA